MAHVEDADPIEKTQELTDMHIEGEQKVIKILQEITGSNPSGRIINVTLF